MQLTNTVLIGFLAANALPHIQKILQFVWDRLISISLYKIQVEESSPFYYSVQEYILNERSEKVKNFYAKTFYDSWLRASPKRNSSLDKTNATLYNHGLQFIWFRGSLIFLHKGIVSVNTTLDPYKNKMHSFVIYTVRKSVIQEFTDYIQAEYGDSWQKVYYTTSDSPKLLGPVHSKTFDNTFLSDGATERLKKDLDTFLKSREIYDELGIRYKRTYLFYGPPGTGKSSLAAAIANYTKRDILTVTLDKNMTDATLIGLIANRPKKCVMLFEDFDCLLDDMTREKKSDSGDVQSEDDSSNSTKITLSCILNVLDGIYTPQDIIFVITTNDLSSIDPAIKRSGRSDVIMEIKQSSELVESVKAKYGLTESNLDSIQAVQQQVINNAYKDAFNKQ